jgi:uncharacterized membrane protein YjjP (DUF1212 family)
MAVTEARTELTSTLRDGSRHADWLVTLGVSVACAAFGRLMGIDWRGVAPVLLGAALVQIIRRGLALHNVNPFISAATAPFLGSALCGLGARWVGSPTAATNVIVPALLLVPGISLFNAQCDILECRPGLGSARAVWAAMMLCGWPGNCWKERAGLCRCWHCSTIGFVAGSPRQASVCSSTSVSEYCPGVPPLEH